MSLVLMLLVIVGVLMAIAIPLVIASVVFLGTRETPGGPSPECLPAKKPMDAHKG